MKHKTEDHIKPCGCRSVGECDHNRFAWAQALDALVDDFAEAMKKRLRKKFVEGKEGWDNPNWPIEDIRKQLFACRDPIDIANFAAFLWNRL